MAFFHDINPVAVTLGTAEHHVSIHWYGLMYILGGLAAYLLGKRRLAQGRLPITLERYGDLMFYAMLGVILGGRIGYILFYGMDQVLENPHTIYRVWEGGMSFHGGLLGVLTAGFFWARKQQLRFFDAIDFVAPLVPIGLGLGRLGNFIGAELWGKHTDLPWGVVFPSSLSHLGKSTAELKAMFAAGQLSGEARHPSQLYELALEGVVLFVVLWIFSTKPRRRYAVSGLFALLYGVFRFAVEFVREPDAQLGYLLGGWVTMGQVLSLPLILIGIVLLVKSRNAPVAYPVAAADATPVEAHAQPANPR
ncbi:prolipoprotein diacylglyceryl transferase [Tahibacter amnicola]|uniref:Phosphatidylglycerol--prolipoprotein diacylglyceryl transferase n=1 Tax=Tahibacter amnicola TaxID=2976241 RepID=A0ABY6BGZ9_9GAMM|nr:prolipoprotein diacylglyceryl transferase [Tahibacter amnicola]UXI67137.1 prolipoprotein diacylglyceryl transferase [Tahibacter amnicola]